jgi:catechol 2,3-dioxygenase
MIGEVDRQSPDRPIADVRIDPSARIGVVHLTIASLDRSVDFYRSRLGFALHGGDEGTARLGAGGADLLVLTESASAPRVRGTTGLYHFAVLTPSRRDLARSLRLLVDTGTVLQGAADHGVSEALYLADPDGNGIEIYRDRPRVEWPFVGGRLRMGADPLDFDGLLGEADGGSAGLAAGTVIGHVHLHVARLDESEAFYVGVLGFELMQRYGAGALFVAAGGYHHHIGLNTWAGVGAPPPPPGAIGLKDFVVLVSGDEALDAIGGRLAAAGVAAERGDGTLSTRDPSANAIRFQRAEAFT